MFFPLYLYNGKLERQRIVRESCCNDVEFTKEAIADQLLRLSDSLNKITGANIIPRNLEIKKDTEVANVFRQFSEMIAKISNGIEIDFVSNYPDTKRIFYTWPEPTEGGGNKSFLHVSIFDEASKIVKGVIQINLNDFDLEDNNAYRVYLVYKDKNESNVNVSTLMEWANKHKDESDPSSVREVVFAKSRIRIKAGQVDEGKNYKDNSLDDISKFLRDFKKYRESMANSNANFLYFIPEYISEGNDPEGKNSLTKKGVGGWPGGIFITTRYKLSLFDLQIIENMVSRIFSVLKICIAEHDALLSNIKSAIGSIMSRNGSHNIGSHVLAALSHNVGTMPDDQVLYQYIQHRMDYIATATTERPSWSQPTMFVGDMMRRFLSQRHLLNYISRSEGLKAWEFQSDRANVEEDGGRIKFHVRKIIPNGVVDFIKYNNPDAPIDFGEDVSLAIPGGIVGQHAFFTIIENIVRNAAKHDWVTPSSKTRSLKSKNGNNLDIYIDFEDNPESDFVKFTIWTRISDVLDGKEEKYNSKYDKCLKIAQPERWKEWLKAKDIKCLPLHWHQEVELSRPFISEDGSLRRENWGLAEMKISAGYLQKSKIEDIGGLGNGGHDIIVPCSIPDTRAGDAKDVTSANFHHLGYRFDVPKSKLILFVVDKMPEGAEGWTPQLGLELKRKGIYLLQESEIDGKKELCYQYIVLDEFNGDKLSWMLPFRIIAAQKRDSSVADKVPLFFNGANTVRGYLGRVIAESKERNGKINIGKVCDTIKENICACWVRHLIAERRKQGQIGNQPSKAIESTLIGDKPISLVVYTLGGNGGAGETLVTDIDIVEYAFNEGLVGALHGFKETGRDADLASKFVDCLLDLTKIKIVEERDGRRSERVINKLVFNKKIEEYYAKRGDIEHDFSRRGIIKRQLSEWLKDWRNNGNYSNDVNAAINFLEDTFDDVVQIDDKIVALEGQRDKFDVLSANWIRFDDDIAEQRKLKLKVQKTKVNPISALVDYLNSYCAQIKGLISKYAEKIATLPNGFSVDGSRQGVYGGRAANQSARQVYDQGWPAAGIVTFNEGILQQGECKEKPTVDTFVLRYWRHQTQKKKADLYLEGLSGTQSYLNTLEKIEKTNYALVARLVENALLRIMIVDERTREFLEQHESLKSTYINMGIFVANDKKVSVELNFLEKGGEVKESNYLMSDGFVNLSANKIDKVRKDYPGEKNKESAREKARQEVKAKYYEQFEILIIHQGIIDKWLLGASHDKAKVEDFINSLKQVFKYVVITTGRGSPANVPNSARVLPFSTIQTTLFKQYPEKMILTDAIMNLLPMKGHGDGQQ